MQLSFDVDWWYGLSYIFNLGYVDIKDYEDWMAFLLILHLDLENLKLPNC